MFSQLKSEVSIMTGVITSAIMLLNGLHEKLGSALATAQENGDLSELQSVTDTLKNETSQLAAAVAANTIADPNAGSVGLTPTPEALGSGDSGNTAQSDGDQSSDKSDSPVVGADAADNADGSGAEADTSAGTDTATEVAVEKTLTAS